MICFEACTDLAPCLFCCCADVKFIASPPSMVAASSMVAAVEGLQTRLAGDCNMSQKMTEQLAQTIRCDPVSTPELRADSASKIHKTGASSGSALGLAEGWSRLCRPLVSTGLPPGLSGTDRVPAGDQPQTGATARRYHGNQERPRGAVPFSHTHRCPGHKPAHKHP